MDPLSQWDSRAKALCSDLNQAILDIAAELFPSGFDVSEDAPFTFEALRALPDTEEMFRRAVELVRSRPEDLRKEVHYLPFDLFTPLNLPSYHIGSPTVAASR